MAKAKLLVDTDIFIDYFNYGLFKNILENRNLVIYYSAVTKKELLSKKGLKDSEKKAIFECPKQHRLISINSTILKKYDFLRQCHPKKEKEDCLIAATAINKQMPLVTKNLKHYKNFPDLMLYQLK